MSPLWPNSVLNVTGLIYVVIIALWVAVLVPMWLRRHDQVSEVRSTARFHHAMQSLGGQRDDAGRSPSRAATHDRHSRPAERDMARTPYRELTPTQQRMAMRRGIILASLTAILAITLVLAIMSVIPRWLPILFAIPVVAFFVASALTSSQRADSMAREQMREARVRRDLRKEMDDVIAATAQKSDDDWENWNAWDDDEWEAVPQTLPTYVNAPRASAIPRPIDRSRPGEWTGEAMVEAARTMRRPKVTFEDVDARANTAEIPVVSDRRAVNE
jgi:hypothetical protein